MTRVLRAFLTFWILLAVAWIPIHSQSVGFLPEIDAHVTVNSFMRTYTVVKNDRDAGASDQFNIGPSVQFYLRPLVTLKRVTAFDLDEARSRPLVVESGYRYIAVPDEPSTQRLQPMATSNFPLRWDFFASDRNRADLDWKAGAFTWRYRNKLTLDHTAAVHSYHVILYAAAEPYYTSQYNKWSTTDLYAGALLPVGKYVQFNCYFEHENDTGKSPNQTKNYVGIALQLYYSLKSK